MNWSHLLLLPLLAGAGLAFFAWLVHLERANRREVAVIIVLALLVLDGALYENPNDVPTGLFHPQLAGQPFRLPDIFVPMALAAAVVGGKRTRRLSAHSFCWAAFLAWLGTEAALGLLAGNSSTLVSFEAKAIIYLGVMALAARLPSEAYVQGRAFRGLLYCSAALSAILTILAPAQVRLKLHVPGLAVPAFGGLGGDPASIFGALGIIALTIAACRKDRRAGLVAAGCVLIIPGVIAGQRAALLGVAVSAVLLLVLAPLGWRRLHLAPQAAFALAALAAALALVPSVLAASLGPTSPIAAKDTAPAFLASAINQTFTRQGKHSSAESRVNQWKKTLGLVHERPVLGWGLGEQYVYWDPGLYAFVQTDLSHDVPLDLLRRSGFIGLALFLVALGVSILRGVRTWRYDSSPTAAALALACVAVIGGLVAKSLVESIFEKYRLAVLLGVTIGMLHSCLRAGDSNPPSLNK